MAVYADEMKEELGRFETKQLTSEREALLFTLSSRCQGIGFIKWYGGIDFRGLAGRQSFYRFYYRLA